MCLSLVLFLFLRGEWGGWSFCLLRSFVSFRMSTLYFIFPTVWILKHFMKPSWTINFLIWQSLSLSFFVLFFLCQRMSLEDAVTFLAVWWLCSAGCDGTSTTWSPFLYIACIDSGPFSGFGTLWGLLRFLRWRFKHLILWVRFFIFTSDGIYVLYSDVIYIL